MKRHAPASRSGSKTGDIFRDFTESQLQKIGAIALAWNEVEFAIDCCLYSGLKLTGESWSSVLSRISANDKLDLLLEITPRNSYPENLSESIKEVSTKAREFKDLRNNVVHCRIFDFSNSIGENIRKGGKISQILLTEDSLQWLYECLVALREEFICVNALIDLNKNSLPHNQSNSFKEDETVQRFVMRFQKAREHQANLGKQTPKFISN